MAAPDGFPPIFARISYLATRLFWLVRDAFLFDGIPFHHEMSTNTGIILVGKKRKLLASGSMLRGVKPIWQGGLYDPATWKAATGSSSFANYG